MALVHQIRKCNLKGLINFSATAFYHDKPVNKPKTRALYVAKLKEKRDAQVKYAEQKPASSIENVIHTIREAYGRIGHTTANTVNRTNPYSEKPRQCFLCENNIEFSYKNAQLLSQFVSPFTGRIQSASSSRVCIPMQRRISHLIRRAQRLGILPYVVKDPRYTQLAIPTKYAR